MGRAANDETAQEFLEGIRVGDLCGGTVADVTRRRVLTVSLDGFPAHPLGEVGPLDLPWGQLPAGLLEVGRRITAEVTAVDLERSRVRLSLAATEHPELWAFLKSLRGGDVLSGTVAAVESFGVFVALDDGPGHPLFPGVGFITIPELSWSHFDDVADVVHVGERVSCEFLYFDTTNGEARLSLRATRPDPFQAFAESVELGQIVRGRVTKLVPFGAFVQVADGVEGLVHVRELTSVPSRPLGERLTHGCTVPPSWRGTVRDRGVT